MEQFEISKTREKREEDYQRILDFMRRNGIKSLDVTNILEEKDRDFGINNMFPELSKIEEEKQNQLFTQRQLLIGKYKRICDQILPLLKLEEHAWRSLDKLNHEICELEGHRLSETVTEEIIPDDIGHSEVGYYRTCLVCGKRVYKEGLTDRDVVVKGESGPKRILYHK